MRVLDVAASREIDRRASTDFGIPSLVLMENAALGVVEAIEEGFPAAQSVLILCGPGNNGGDGLAVARHLELRGYIVEVWLIGERETTGDAAVQESTCRRQGLDLKRVRDREELPAQPRDWDLVVDALFGIGLSRPLGGVFHEVAEWLNEQETPCVAIDLPSGLFGDSATANDPHVVADITVTFEAPKPAHVLPPACDAVGDLIVASLGVPWTLTAEAPGHLDLATAELAAVWLGRRAPGEHKGDFGHVLIVAGSVGMGGAAVLAARGAIRGGAGLVTCAVPEDVLATVDAASLESMTLGLPATPEGSLSAAAVELLVRAAEERDVLALGPGLGTSQETATAVVELVRRTRGPLVLDASALAPFAGRLEVLRDRPGPSILTPHAAELASLLGVDTATVVADRVGSVRRAARESGSVVVLKGQATLIAEAERVIVNSTGNPGMATGGTGDVLTGLIGALWARALARTTRGAAESAALGAFVHGAAGDLAAQRLGETALAATDLLQCIPEVLRNLEES